MEVATVTAETLVQVDAAAARRWFLELETHPERYRFETHAGFTFTRGSFGEVGARFQTREQFCGLPLSLSFELTEVEDARFRFRLTRPRLPVWGAFTIKEAGDETTALCLAVGGATRLGTWFLRLPPVRVAVGRQIRSEVEHIKASINSWR